MKKQELIDKSDTENKGQVLRGRSAQKGSELDGNKLEDYFQQIGAESSPERLLSILTSPELSHPINALQKLNIINELQKNYGNSNIQRMIQAKLKIGQSNDKYEQEAERIAEQVMRMPEPSAQRQQEREEKGKEDGEILLTKGVLGQASKIPSDLESRINSTRGSGQPLPKSIRAFFEPRFSYDFSKVRIHAHDPAGEMASMLRARAFTFGRNIVFGVGQYSPDTMDGRQLIGHELAHVVQQEKSGLLSSNKIIQRRERRPGEGAEIKPQTPEGLRWLEESRRTFEIQVMEVAAIPGLVKIDFRIKRRGDPEWKNINFFGGGLGVGLEIPIGKAPPLSKTETCTTPHPMEIRQLMGAGKVIIAAIPKTDFALLTLIFTRGPAEAGFADVTWSFRIRPVDVIGAFLGKFSFGHKI